MSLEMCHFGHVIGNLLIFVMSFEKGHFCDVIGSKGIFGDVIWIVPFLLH